MIVQALPPLPSGGAEMQALKLAKKLTDKGIFVLFITPGKGKIKGYTELDGIPVYRLHSFLNLITEFLFYIQKKVPEKAVKIEYDDNVEVNNAITRKIGIGARLRYLIFLVNAYFFMRKKKDVIKLLHVHTIEWPAYIGASLSKWFHLPLIVKDSTMNGIFNILRYPQGRQKQQLIVKQAHFVAMTKEILRNYIIAGIPKDHIAHIPNGIDIIDGQNQKSKSSNGMSVLFVGNLYQQPAKGVDVLLKSWKLVQENCLAARLMIVGEGDLDSYKSYAEGLGITGSVRFLGKQADPGSLMMNADIFVLPSRREGMSNALMEAMLRGLPCVATNISGSADLITGGVNGLLVPAGDVTSLAAAIEFMLRNPEDAKRMGNMAKNTIEEKCNMNTVANQYYDLYKMLLLKQDHSKLSNS